MAKGRPTKFQQYLDKMAAEKLALVPIEGVLKEARAGFDTIRATNTHLDANLDQTAHLH